MKISDAKTLLKEIVNYNLEQFQKDLSNKTYLTPIFIGDPGVGKTAIPSQTAKELDLAYHITVVAQYDAGEMGGLSSFDKVTFEREDGSTYDELRTIRARPGYMPHPMMEDGVVAIWNFDEAPQAFLANQNILSQLVNDYRIGEHLVSPGVTMCCTGNKPENKAGTTPMPMHLRDRLMFITIEPDHKESMTYANQMGWHTDVRAYLGKNPASLHRFVPGANANPTPRSWEKTSSILKLNLSTHIRTEAVLGQIGEEAHQFEQWLRVKDRMPDPFEVCRDPMNQPIFDEKDADVLFILMHNLVEIANDKTIEGQIKYLLRMKNAEFWAVWAKHLGERWPNFKHKALTQFKLEKMPKLF